MRILNNIFIILIVTINISCKIDSEKEEKTKKLEDIFEYDKKFNNSDSIPDIKLDNQYPITIKIPDDLDKKYINKDTILKSVTTVQLETSEQALIAEIDELLFIDDKIIVADKSRNQKAYIFTKEGTFVNQIGQLGRGPSEYSHLSDITVDHENRHIIILDNRKLLLHYYDTKGSLIKQIKVPYYSHNIAILNNNNFLFSQIHNGNLHLPAIKNSQIIIADSTQKIVGKSFPYDQPKYHPDLMYRNKSNIVEIKDKVLFNPIFTNNIYEFNDINGSRLKYKIELGDRDVLKRLKTYKTNEELTNASNINRLRRVYNPGIEAGNYYYLRVINAGYSFYNTKTEKLIYGISDYNPYDTSNNQNSKELQDLPFRVYDIIASTGNDFVAVVYPGNILEGGNLESKKYKNVKKPVFQNDNPILVFLSLKDYPTTQ